MFDDVDGKWFGEKEALDLADPLGPEMVDLGGTFDAFGEGLETEVFAEWTRVRMRASAAVIG